MTQSAAAQLREELGQVFRRGCSDPLGEEEFDELARRAFGLQFESTALYRRFAEARELTPDRCDHWTRVPAVPTSAFKRFVFKPDQAEAERVFRTSGTGSRSRRGEHHVVDLSLYDDALLPNFRAHLIADDEPPELVALASDPERAPDSSLSYMLGRARERLCGSGGGFFFDTDMGVDVPSVESALEALSQRSRPVLVAGTAFAFAIWAECSPRFRVRLPAGSLAMETGGFKGRVREVSRQELYTEIGSRLGLATDRVVAEYGMTELLSQFYEPVLHAPHGRRRFVPPPWVRTRVLDPVSLDPVPDGRTGILAHFDLANLLSVSAVITEDLGVWQGDGFTVLGRAPGAEPRGCSLTVEELENAAHDADRVAGARPDPEE